jgi:predicted amidophosphoribosyltransferase
MGLGQIPYGFALFIFFAGIVIIILDETKICKKCSRRAFVFHKVCKHCGGELEKYHWQ